MKTLILATATAASIFGSLGLGGAAFAQQASGSYQNSCRNTRIANGALTAECADTQGHFRYSSLPYAQCRGDIGNQNGMLVCNGAVASGGAIVDNQGGGGPNRRPGDGGYGRQAASGDYNRRPNDGDNNRGRGDNNGAFTAGAAGLIAGALLGDSLGGQGDRGDRRGPPPALYAQGYAYPTFGDARYGDPRVDPRYDQGGWGYGHRPGEWVSIRDRADWLGRRIDRGVQDGQLSRRDARDLRGQLRSLLDLERYYARDWRLDGRERADLDQRFDGLAARIRFEARNDSYDNGYRRDGGDDRPRGDDYRR